MVNRVVSPVAVLKLLDLLVLHRHLNLAVDVQKPEAGLVVRYEGAEFFVALERNHADFCAGRQAVRLELDGCCVLRKRSGLLSEAGSRHNEGEDGGEDSGVCSGKWPISHGCPPARWCQYRSLVWRKVVVLEQVG